MPYYAKLDQNNKVIEVITCLPGILESGMFGDPSHFIECSIDGSIRGDYPGQGWEYDPIKDYFHPEKPEFIERIGVDYREPVLPSYTWRNGSWRPPQDNPGDFLFGPPWPWQFRWDEPSTSWIPITNPADYEVEKYWPNVPMPQKIYNGSTDNPINNPHYGKTPQDYKT